VLIHAKVEYYNQRSELVALGTGYSIKTETSRFKEVGKYTDIAIHHNTPEDLERIYAAQAQEVIRGPEPRWWESVEEGDELEPVVQGPASPFDNVALYAGCGLYSVRADRLMQTSPYGTDYPMPPHPDTGGFANHLTFSIDSRVAKWRHDLQGAVVIGIHRMARSMIPFTNWMGDDAFLWRFYNRVTRFVLIGDTVWCKGQVKRKHIENGRHCVDIDSWGENQRGEMVQKGSATIILPSIEGGPVQYPTP
jgi:hypothetical protein